MNEQYIIDAEGKKTAVVLPYAEWRKILELLEELDDIRTYDEAKKQPSDLVSLDQALQDLGKKNH